MVDPTRFARRSPLRRAFPESAAWGSLDDVAVVRRIEGRETIDALAIADLSPLPRLGFKGRGTMPAMEARNIVVEPQPNRAFRQPDGGLCLVLGLGEVLLLGALDGRGAKLSELEASWSIDDEEHTYPVPRRDSHAWLALAGPAAPDMFAKLCGVDLRLRVFPDRAIAQTSVARLNAIVVRADCGATPVFHLLADSASAAYLLACLLDAAAEFGGGLIGLDSFVSQVAKQDAQRSTAGLASTDLGGVSGQSGS